jgi:hypothetical protein
MSIDNQVVRFIDLNVSVKIQRKEHHLSLKEFYQ